MKTFILPGHAEALHFISMWNDLMGNVNGLFMFLYLPWSTDRCRMTRQFPKLFLVWTRIVSELKSKPETIEAVTMEIVAKAAMSLFPAEIVDLWKVLVGIALGREPRDVFPTDFADLCAPGLEYPSALAFIGHFPLQIPVGRTYSQSLREEEKGALPYVLSTSVAPETHFTLDQVLVAEEEEEIGRNEGLKPEDFQYVVQTDEVDAVGEALQEVALEEEGVDPSEPQDVDQTLPYVRSFSEEHRGRILCDYCDSLVRNRQCARSIKRFGHALCEECYAHDESMEWLSEWDVRQERRERPWAVEHAGGLRRRFLRRDERRKEAWRKEGDY
jgi:hypothetical protein